MRAADNPFTTAYQQREIAWYGLPDGAEPRAGDVQLRWCEDAGEQIDYFNWHFNRTQIRYPALYIGEKRWMSLTRLEVQSVALPIRLARGDVGTAGLGMGYFPLRAAAKRTVRQVTVYEQHEDVIAWFRAAHGHRPELAKITIVAGDVRERMRGRSFDYVWMDPYDMWIYPRAIADAQLFRAANRIGHYRYWTLERLLLDAQLMGEVVPELLPEEQRFFDLWARTRHDGPVWATLKDFWVPVHWPEQQRGVLEALGRSYAKGSLFVPTRVLTDFQRGLVEMICEGNGIPAWA